MCKVPGSCAVVLDFGYRKRQVGTLTTQIGVYILADLDDVPIYVGQSTQGIRQRVQRHLTSARSDIIANRQLDVWEIAWVWAFPVNDKAQISALESILYHKFHAISPLVNGTVPALPPPGSSVPPPAQKVQVMRQEHIEERQNPEFRLPRQATHYADIVGHFLAVKNSRQIARAMDGHFQRLARYHDEMLRGPVEDEDGGDD